MIDTPKEILRFLTKHDVFPSLTPEELQNFSSHAFIQSYQTGEYIFRIGEPSDFFYIVMSGSVQLNIKGMEYATLERGEIFGPLGVITEMKRTSDTLAAEPTKVIMISGQDLFNPAVTQPPTAIKTLRYLTRQMASFIVAHDGPDTMELIQKGEDEKVAFKPTLRVNPNSGLVETKVENNVLKTIAAFMNSKGGTLLIGIEKNGELVGLNRDGFESNDKMLMHLAQLVKDRMGNKYFPNVHCKVVEVTHVKLLRVDCVKASDPLYLKFDDEERFYVRSGPTTTSLRLSKVYPYIKKRFHA